MSTIVAANEKTGSNPIIGNGKRGIDILLDVGIRHSFVTTFTSQSSVASRLLEDDRRQLI
jgi:hypothetical protein